MANKKTDSSNSPRSDDPAHPTKGGLSAKPKTASEPAGAEPRLDTRFHRTSLRFCCAANVVTASEAREPDVCRDCSNRLLERAARMPLDLALGGNRNADDTTSTPGGRGPRELLGSTTAPTEAPEA